MDKKEGDSAAGTACQCQKCTCTSFMQHAWRQRQCKNCFHILDDHFDTTTSSPLVLSLSASHPAPHHHPATSASSAGTKLTPRQAFTRLHKPQVEAQFPSGSPTSTTPYSVSGSPRPRTPQSAGIANNPFIRNSRLTPTPDRSEKYEQNTKSDSIKDVPKTETANTTPASSIPATSDSNAKESHSPIVTISPPRTFRFNLPKAAPTSVATETGSSSSYYSAAATDDTSKNRVTISTTAVKEKDSSDNNKEATPTPSMNRIPPNSKSSISTNDAAGDSSSSGSSTATTCATATTTTTTTTIAAASPFRTRFNIPRLRPTSSTSELPSASKIEIANKAATPSNADIGTINDSSSSKLVSPIGSPNAENQKETSPIVDVPPKPAHSATVKPSRFNVPRLPTASTTGSESFSNSPTSPIPSNGPPKLPSSNSATESLNGSVPSTDSILEPTKAGPPPLPFSKINNPSPPPISSTPPEESKASVSAVISPSPKTLENPVVKKGPPPIPAGHKATSSQTDLASMNINSDSLKSTANDKADLTEAKKSVSTSIKDTLNNLPPASLEAPKLLNESKHHSSTTPPLKFAAQSPPRTEIILEALYDFAGTGTEEVLPFAQGDRFVKLGTIDQWFSVRSIASSREGIVPMNYVQVVDASTTNNSAPISTSTSVSATFDTTKSPPPSAAVNSFRPTPSNATVPSFIPVNESRSPELSTTSIPESRLNIDKVVAPSANESTITQYEALYDFSAKDEVQLSMKAGEIFVLDKPGVPFPGWYSMKNKEGKVGIVPVSYVKLVETKQAHPPALSVDVSSDPFKDIASVPLLSAFSSQVETPVHKRKPSSQFMAEILQTMKEPSKAEIAPPPRTSFSGPPPLMSNLHSRNSSSSNPTNPTPASTIIPPPRPASRPFITPPTLTPAAQTATPNPTVSNANAITQPPVQSTPPRPTSIRVHLSPKVEPTTATTAIPQQPQLLCLYAYTAMDDTQLSFNAEEKLILVNQEFSTWWRATNSIGKSGLVPVNYVKLLESTSSRNLPTDSTVKITSTSNAKGAENLNSLQSSVINDQAAPKLEQYRALYTYSATDSTQLSMAANEVFTILNKGGSGWWTAKSSTGKEGRIPSNYLQPATL